RAGSSIAAELGLMRATDQITALGLMAIDPVGKAVAPRFWAALICVPLLTAFFCSLAISGSWFEAVHVIGIDGGSFWQVMKGAAGPGPRRRASLRAGATPPSRPPRAPRWRPAARWSTPRWWC